MGRSSLNSKPRSKYVNSFEKPYPPKLKVDLPSFNNNSNKIVTDPWLLQERVIQIQLLH